MKKINKKTVFMKLAFIAVAMVCVVSIFRAGFAHILVTTTDSVGYHVFLYEDAVPSDVIRGKYVVFNLYTDTMRECGYDLRSVELYHVLCLFCGHEQLDKPDLFPKCKKCNHELPSVYPDYRWNLVDEYLVDQYADTIRKSVEYITKCFYCGREKYDKPDEIVLCNECKVLLPSVYQPATNVVPCGPFCHEEMNTKILCPFWEIRTNRPYQQNGFCRLMCYGDWSYENGLGMLWDQVKECGINVAPRDYVRFGEETIIKNLDEATSWKSKLS